jgi:hypothetical protein
MDMRVMQDMAHRDPRWMLAPSRGPLARLLRWLRSRQAW